MPAALGRDLASLPADSHPLRIFAAQPDLWTPLGLRGAEEIRTDRKQIA